CWGRAGRICHDNALSSRGLDIRSRPLTFLPLASVVHRHHAKPSRHSLSPCLSSLARCALSRAMPEASCGSRSASAATRSHASATSSKVTLSSGRVISAAKARQSFAFCLYSSALRINPRLRPSPNRDGRFLFQPELFRYSDPALKKLRASTSGAGSDGDNDDGGRGNRRRDDGDGSNHSDDGGT